MISKLDNKILVGICTYNRQNILEKSIESLKKVNGIDLVDVVVFDDCSSDYDDEYLKKLIPFATCINRQKINVGADKNTSDMYEYFLKSEYEWLFNADSDLIYSMNIIEKISEYKEKCNGFMTFFNCINHKNIGEKCGFILKDEVGAAGCLLNKEVVKMILNNIKYRTTGFDVNFSKLLINKGYDLYCTKKSYVQHIGITGFNSRDIKFDYGMNFDCDNDANGRIVEETFEEYMKIVSRYRTTKQYKCFYFVTSIPRRIKKIVQIVTGGRIR